MSSPSWEIGSQTPEEAAAEAWRRREVALARRRELTEQNRRRELEHREMQRELAERSEPAGDAEARRRHELFLEDARNRLAILSRGEPRRLTNISAPHSAATTIIDNEFSPNDFRDAEHEAEEKYGEYSADSKKQEKKLSKAAEKVAKAATKAAKTELREAQKLAEKLANADLTKRQISDLKDAFKKHALNTNREGYKYDIDKEEVAKLTSELGHKLNKKQINQIAEALGKDPVSMKRALMETENNAANAKLKTLAAKRKSEARKNRQLDQPRVRSLLRRTAHLLEKAPSDAAVNHDRSQAFVKRVRGEEAKEVAESSLPWLLHVRKYRFKYPGMSWKQALEGASASYVR